jgi:hypothetical protein
VLKWSGKGEREVKWFATVGVISCFLAAFFVIATANGIVDDMNKHERRQVWLADLQVIIQMTCSTSKVSQQTHCWRLLQVLPVSQSTRV